MKSFTLFYRSNKAKGSTCVACLVKQQKWKKVIETLNANNNGQHTVTFKCKNICSDFENYPTVVHYACRLQPPLSVISAMIVEYPGSVFQQDFMNRYPLHIACEHGASTEVIRDLIRKNQEAVISQDIDGNIPLHLSLMNYYHTKKDDDIDLFQNSILLSKLQYIILKLSEAKPASVLVRNARDMNAHDVALRVHADPRIIHVMQALTACAERGELNEARVREAVSRCHEISYSKSKIVPI